MCRKILLVLAMMMGLVAPVPVMARSASTYDSAQDFYFRDFTADYYLTKNEDGTSQLHVKEVLTAEFPKTNQNHGIMRMIPVYNQDGQNTVVMNEEALNLSVKRNGKTEKVSRIVDNGDHLAVYIGDAIEYVKGEQVYTLEYDFENVVTEFDVNGDNVSGREGVSEAWQELYWDTNGTGWQQRFDKVTANVHLPVGMTGEPSCYVGKEGEKGSERCEISELDDGVSFSARNLAAGENLTFSVEMAPGSFVVVRHENYLLVAILVLELIVSGVGILFVWLRWNKKGRPQRKLYKETFVKPEYQPPAGLNVAEGGMMWIWRNDRTYVPTLLELAVAKAVTITDSGAVEGAGLLKRMGFGRWTVTINVNPAQLSGSQLNMLRILANKDTLAQGEVIEVRRHRASYRTGIWAEDYVRDAEQVLVGAGYLVDVRKHGLKKLGMMLLTMLWLMAEGFLMLLSTEVVAGGMVVVGATVIPIVCRVLMLVTIGWMIWLAIMTTNYSKYTEKGVALARVIEGLRLYVKMVETERLKFLQSVQGVDTSPEGIVNLYEKMLPWASLFGCEQSWANELNRYYEMTEVKPAVDTWMLNGVVLADLTSNVRSTMASSVSSGSSSSSSSGGGGGGSSGGGGGGGGGGGW